MKIRRNNLPFFDRVWGLCPWFYQAFDGVVIPLGVANQDLYQVQLNFMRDEQLINSERIEPDLRLRKVANLRKSFVKVRRNK